jgi:hypothetical protein
MKLLAAEPPQSLLPDRPTTPDELLPRFDFAGRGRDHQADALVAPADQAVDQVVVFLGALAALAFQAAGEVQALLHLERTAGAQVDGAADARQGVGRVGRLVDQHLVHQLGGHVQQVRLGRAHVAGAQILLAVQQGDDLGQAADVDRRAFAGVTLDLHARNALQRVGDGGVGQLADVFRRNRVDDRGFAPLDVDRAHLRAADAGDDDFLDLRGRRPARPGRRRPWPAPWTRRPPAAPGSCPGPTRTDFVDWTRSSLPKSFYGRS